METFHEMRPTEISKGYDEKYGSSNYFGYRIWLYRPFVEALVARVGLRPGGHLLDAGCGQGFFTWLFAERGLNAVGVDVSAAGVSSARDIYSSSGAKFEIYLNLDGETSLTAFLQGHARCTILRSSKRSMGSQTGFLATFGRMAF